MSQAHSRDKEEKKTSPEDSIHCSLHVCIGEASGLIWDPSNNVFMVEESSSGVAEE